MIATPTEADILRFAAALPADQPERFVAIGGLPRAGTSSCERALHGFRNVFVADEFHALADPSYLAGLQFMMRYIETEADIWQDASGRTWRETTLKELEWRRMRSLLVSLLLFTRPSKFASKAPADLRVFGFKLPVIEDVFASVWPVFGDKPMPFVYCARNPTEILDSQWKVPWVSATDEKSFSSIIRHQINVSLSGYDRVVAAGGPVAVWRTPSHPNDVADVMAQLGLAHLAGSRAIEDVGVVDEWPNERRRLIAPISHSTKDEFANSPEVKAYRETFGV